jgi:hypothetical protein
MPDEFAYDVFLSYSAKDKAVVRDVAKRLKKEGLRVWFDEWVLKPGDSIPAKIEEGLERSRVLVLCMSANAFGSDWAQLESSTFRFRDPLNKERRFVPLRLDNTPIKGSLAQFLHIDWHSTDAEEQCVRILEICRSAIENTLGVNPDLDGDGPDLGDGSTTNAATITDSMQIDITIDRDFDSYSEKDQKRLLRAIGQFLGVGGEIRVRQKRRGSVKLRLEISQELAERLLWVTTYLAHDGSTIKSEVA